MNNAIFSICADMMCLVTVSGDKSGSIANGFGRRCLNQVSRHRKYFTHEILSPSLGKIHGGRTVARRRGASNIDDAELRGRFLENSVTEEAMAAKLKVGSLKIVPETWPKRCKPKRRAARVPAWRTGSMRLLSELSARFLACAPCTFAPGRIPKR